MTEEPVRVGVSGLGRGFMLTLPGLLHHPRIRLVAAADPRPEARDRFVAELGGSAYEDFAALCADDAVELIYIASPHAFHAAQAIAAARAGKHVLVEKPMALDLGECRAMVAASEAAGVHMMVGPSHGYDAPIALTRSLIESGAYGRVRMMSMLTYTDFLHRPRRPEELDPEQGGGVVFSQAAHQIDIVRRLAGSELRSVFARIGDWDAARPSEGAYTASLAFADGGFASLTYSGYGNFDSDELCGWISELGTPKKPGAIAGRPPLPGPGAEETALKMSRAYGARGIEAAAPPPHHEHFGQLIVSCDRADFRPTPTAVHEYGPSGIRLHPLSPPRSARAEVLEEAVAAVRDGIAPLHDARWGAATIAACAALRQSAHERREVAIPPLDP